MAYWGGLFLLALWALYLGFQVFFWTGMGLQGVPQPVPRAVYWRSFLEMLGHVLGVAAGGLGVITWPLVFAVLWGREARRRK